jgi:serine/threonine protein kinase
MDVYEVIKTIGSGSFGQVYMVRHKRECKNYVIKKVKTRDMNPKDLENTENEVSAHFLQLQNPYFLRLVSNRSSV